MPGFPLGVNTIADSWTLPAEDSLRRLAGLGYDRFDVMVSPAHLDTEDLVPQDLRRMRALLSERGLGIHALTAQNLDHNLASPRAEIRRMTVAFNKRLLFIAGALDIAGIVVVPGRVNRLNAPPAPQLAGWLDESIEALLPYAERTGVKLFIENVPVSIMPGAAELVDWIRKIDNPALRICYDVTNGHFIGEAPDAAIRTVAPWLDLVHLSDTTRDSWKHDPVGTGTVDFAAAAAALRDVNYRGLSVVELAVPDADAAIVASHQKLAAMGWAQPRAA